MAKKTKAKITNFNKNSSFFFHIENFLNFINEKSNKNYLKPTEKEIKILKELIEKYEKNLGENEKIKDKIITVKSNFFNELKRFEPINKSRTEYGTNVENIINLLKKDNIKINLKNIQIKYLEIYNKKYSLMTFSRILKNHLNLHFLKTTLKNPKLKKNLYKFMTYFFIKGIVRGLSLQFKLLFIDETAYKLVNNNYYNWRKKDEMVIGGAENDLKKQLNMISAIDDTNVVHYKFSDNPVNNKVFKNFMNELCEKIGQDNIKNYLIIFDNAKCHIAKTTKKFLIEKNLKVLTNIPYYSDFNGIEFLFLNIKSHLYKMLIKNRKELKKEIESVLNQGKMKITIRKIYLNSLKKYLKFIDENINENINTIYENL